jgi:hypothetical protein
MKRSAAPPGRALIVAFDRDRIAMSLRANDATPVDRDIPTPTDRAARLRAIAWLAGNLARDQVTPIVADVPINVPSLATIPTPTAPAVTEPPPQASVTPPPTERPPALDSTIAISTRAREEKPAGPPRWSILVGDGPTTNFPVCPLEGPMGRPVRCLPFARGTGTAWRLEVQRHHEKDGFFAGVALEGTAGDLSPELVGASAFVGSSRHLGRWSFELTAGAGLELAEVFTSTLTAMESSTNGFTSYVTSSNALRPSLFADGSVGLAHPVSDSLDVLLRLGAHLTTVTYANWFLSSTIGLRYNIP